MKFTGGFFLGVGGGIFSWGGRGDFVVGIVLS